jgi:hypothetical protein
VPTTKRISIAPRLVEQITVDLAGKEYVVPTPKAAIGLMMAERMSASGDDGTKVLRELETWILATFGPKQGPKVFARLADPDDGLDIQQIVEMIQKITEESTPNPTT